MRPNAALRPVRVPISHPTACRLPPGPWVVDLFNSAVRLASQPPPGASIGTSLHGPGTAMPSSHSPVSLHRTTATVEARKRTVAAHCRQRRRRGAAIRRRRAHNAGARRACARRVNYKPPFSGILAALAIRTGPVPGCPSHEKPSAPRRRLRRYSGQKGRQLLQLRDRPPGSLQVPPRNSSGSRRRPSTTARYWVHRRTELIRSARCTRRVIMVKTVTPCARAWAPRFSVSLHRAALLKE
jgi:hypothetical protein